MTPKIAADGHGKVSRPLHSQGPRQLAVPLSLVVRCHVTTYPNPKLVLAASFLLLSSSVVAQEEQSIGYSSVAAALEALRADPSAEITVQDGWTIIAHNENGQYVLWSFTPTDHPAHPAAVKRTIYESDGAIHIGMSALCQADKSDCDALMEEFKELNNGVREAIRNGA